MDFVHLHTHSRYSLGRAVPRVRDLVARAAELKMPAIALTDNNSVAGMGELARAAEEFGVRPILGCELDVLPSGHGLYQGRTHRLTLLVESETGFRNLVALITSAHNRPADQPVHVSFSDFLRHLRGLIVLTGSPRSELYWWLREGKTAETKTYLNRLVSEIGRENLLFEVIEYPHPRIRRVMEYVLELSRFLRIPAVATQNVHFLDPEDMPAYCALVQHPHQLVPRWPLPDEELPTRHFTTAQEMRKRFAYTPEIVDETLLVARRCAFAFPSRRPLIPVPDFERGQDPASVLWDKAVRGAQSRYGALSVAVKDRLNREYSDIRDTENGAIDLTEYLLFLHEIASFMRESGLCAGVGSGRLTSSVFAYALGIVEADPLAYEIEYEPLRVVPGHYPPFEIQASSSAMERVLEWLRARHGERNLASVGRWVDWPRGRLFQHLCRWAGLSETNLRQFRSDRALAPEAEPDVEEEEAPRERPAGKWAPDTDEDVETGPGEAASHLPPLGEGRIPRDVSLRQHRTLADAVYRLHPCLRALEADRAQYVLSREPLADTVATVPLSAEERVTQGDADLLDQLHMLRIEFSSIPLLNVLESALGWIRQENAPSFSLGDIPLDDEQTFRLLSLGLTNGISPLHSITVKSLLRAESPRSIAALLDFHTRAARHKPDDRARAGRAASLPDCILSYWCAYMKVHYPVPFMAAMLTHSVSSHTAAAQRPRFQILLRETRKMGIEILGPHINFSGYEFSQEGRKIRTGLVVIHGMGRQTFDEIAQVRHGLPFSGLSDFCQRTDPRRVPFPLIVNLIKAGAFDGLGGHRGRLLVEFERALKNARLTASGAPKATRSAATSRRGAGAGADAQLQLFDPSMFGEETPAPREEPAAEHRPLSQRDIMRYEQEAVGYGISFDLLDYYEDLIRSMHTITPFEVNARMEGKTIHVAGFVDHIEREGPLIDEGTETVLDLEGHVVKVPPKTVDDLSRLLSSRSPILIEGVVRRQARSECYLEARAIHLLDEVARKAEQVGVLRLNLAGENARTLARVRNLIRTYRGNTRVEVENHTGLSRWTARGVHNAGVFFCPPLYQGLQSLLATNRIRILDRNGKRMNDSKQ